MQCAMYGGIYGVCTKHGIVYPTPIRGHVPAASPAGITKHGFRQKLSKKFKGKNAPSFEKETGEFSSHYCRCSKCCRSSYLINLVDEIVTKFWIRYLMECMECIPASVLCEYLSCRYGEFGAKRQYIEIDMGEKARYFH